MANILDKVPGIIAKATGTRLFRPATYTVLGPPSGPSWDPTPGQPVDYPCRALEDSWSAYSQAGGLVAASDRKILILADGFAVEPVEGASVTVGGKTFTLVSDGGSAPAVATDPAKAVWVCRGRA